MVTEHDFDLKKPELAQPIADLNEMIADLGIDPPVQGGDANNLYGENVFGIRFNGVSALALGVDAVSGAFWPTDEEAISVETAKHRDYLLVCANYPDLGRTEALQYFATFQPGTSPWISEEEDGSEIVRVANTAVNIDSSAKLKDARFDELPPKYVGPKTSYPMNLFWLTQTMGYNMAIIEVNRKMHVSLAGSGLQLGRIAGAMPRVIDEIPYKRFVIDPSTARNSEIVDFTKYIPPNTFHVTSDGHVVADNNLVAGTVNA